MNRLLGYRVFRMWKPLLTVVFCFCNGAQCNIIDYPPFVDLTLMDGVIPTGIGHPGQFIVHGLRLNCSGFIQRWEFYCLHNGSHPIEFHVWRKFDTSQIRRTYSLVGTNFFRDSQPDKNNLLSLSVPHDEQIRVQPGDTVGMRTIIGSNEDEDYQIQAHFEIDDQAPTIYSYSFAAGFGTPVILDLDNPFAFTPFEFPLTPIMRITVADTMPTHLTTTELTGSTNLNNPTTPTTLNDLTESSSFPPSAIIAVAVSVGAVMLTLLLTCFSVIVWCCVFRSMKHSKKTEPPAASRNHNIGDSYDHEGEMEYNAAYSVPNSIELEINAAYSAPISMECTQSQGSTLPLDNDSEMQYNSLYDSASKPSASATGDSGSTNYSLLADYTPKGIKSQNEGSVYYSEIPDGCGIPVQKGVDENDPEYEQINVLD